MYLFFDLKHGIYVILIIYFIYKSVELIWDGSVDVDIDSVVIGIDDVIDDN
jgi:hypothetical protein